MAKWADYLISAVHYEDDVISSLKVHEDKGDKVSAFSVWKRNDVIISIHNGKSFYTIYRSNDKWNKGEEVHVITIGNVSYLQTDKNNIAKDNLGNLPKF